MHLANLLEAKELGVKGDNLFVDILPAEIEQAILLRNPSSGTLINHELPGFFKTEFQLIVRVPAGSHDAGDELINNVVKALSMEFVQIENHFYQYCRPRNEPVVSALPPGSLLELNVTFACCFVKG
jgi:hypothetical protein